MFPQGSVPLFFTVFSDCLGVRFIHMIEVNITLGGNIIYIWANILTNFLSKIGQHCKVPHSIIGIQVKCLPPPMK